MKVILLSLVLLAHLRPHCIQADLPSYLIGSGQAGYACVAPVPGDTIQRLPVGYRPLIVNFVHYYSYGGVYYVEDFAFGSRIWRVIDPPIVIGSSHPIGKLAQLTLNGIKFTVTLNEQCQFYVENDIGLTEVAPPAGSYLEGLPSGAKSLLCGDLRCYSYNGVLYTRTSINCRSVYVAIDKTGECE